MLDRQPMISALLALFGLLSLAGAATAIIAAVRARALESAQRAYLAGSAAALGLLLFHVSTPRAVRLELLQAGPNSDLTVTLLCVGLAWLLLGVLLLVLRVRAWTPERIVTLVSFVLLALLYLNVLRERSEFGDLNDYVRAADEIAHGLPLHYRYVYPPLLATLLSPFVPLGARAVFVAALLANYLSLGLLFFLLRSVLVRYGFARITATLVTWVALAVNVAVLRTLFYGQINLHVTNLILLSLLAYPTHAVPSALALAIAVHLKSSPIVLALPFLLRRDTKWLGAFAAGLVGIVALTSSLNGFERYFEYLHNVQDIYRANGINYRDNSVDSLVRATLQLAGQDLAHAFWPVQIARAAILALSLSLCVRAVRGRTFLAVGSPSAQTVYNAYPVLLLLLLIFSPLVWEHHPVFIVLTMCLLASRIDGPGDGVIFLVAWFLCFVTPTFDFYPLSYRILVAVALAYWLAFRVTGRPPVPGRWFDALDRGLAHLPVLFAPGARAALEVALREANAAPEPPAPQESAGATPSDGQTAARALLRSPR